VCFIVVVVVVVVVVVDDDDDDDNNNNANVVLHDVTHRLCPGLIYLPDAVLFCSIGLCVDLQYCFLRDRKMSMKSAYRN